MRTKHARKIREGIRVGRMIIASSKQYGSLTPQTQMLYNHPSLKDPLTEQAKYRTMVHMWSNQ